MVEEYSAHIVEMAVQSKQAATGLERPDLDLVVVTSGYEQRLRLVEVDTSHRTIVLFKAINQGAHTVIP